MALSIVPSAFPRVGASPQVGILESEKEGEANKLRGRPVVSQRENPGWRASAWKSGFEDLLKLVART